MAMTAKKMKTGMINSILKHSVCFFHSKVVSKRRASVLAFHLSQLLDDEKVSTGIDIGCGDGGITLKLERLRPGLKITGFDVICRKHTSIPVAEFNGKTIPLKDNSCDFVMLINVLHHVDDPFCLLSECSRVARSFILIADHISKSFWDERKLKFMDWFGNMGSDINIPTSYISRENWKELFQKANLNEVSIKKRLGLYPFPFSLLFDSTLHFIAKLNIN